MRYTEGMCSRGESFPARFSAAIKRNTKSYYQQKTDKNETSTVYRPIQNNSRIGEAANSCELSNLPSRSESWKYIDKRSDCTRTLNMCLMMISSMIILSYQRVAYWTIQFLNVIIIRTDIMGLGPLVSTKGTKAKAVLLLIFEGITGILLIMGMLVTAEDYYDALTNVTALTTVYQTIIKSVVLLQRRQSILEGIHFLSRFWQADKFGDRSEKKMVSYQRLGRTVLRTFRVFGTITASLYLSKPLLEGKRALPMLCYPLCDMRSNRCYIFHYIFLVASLASQCVTLLGFDGLFFTLLMCAYSEVEQIKYALYNLKVKVREVNQDVLNEMSAVIEHHNLVLEYISKFDGLFQITLLHQFGATLFSYCSGLFLLTVSGFPPPAGEFLRSGLYVACVFLQILIYCVVGEKIAEQTGSLADHAYQIEWTNNYHPKLRKMLMLFIQRAQIRSQITAGGIWDLNMTTFASILRGSMSMLAFMQAVYRTRN